MRYNKIVYLVYVKIKSI